ncbi:hypothetical protein K6U29_06780 [Vibrio parahaemolyticus]|nr:hypothetical protein [Vibrio parahaemolyticus]MCG6455492.1 hypothetical protein [Vibrio parahaemolyticus]TOF18210.1 hypothetical protein CGJ26_24270 [Vibrio parahaemolyticus]
MSFLNMVLRGNIKRIKELHSIGQRPDAIVSLFKKHGIDISESLVTCVIRGELDELDRVALPKSAVASLQAEIDNLASGLLPA